MKLYDKCLLKQLVSFEILSTRELKHYENDNDDTVIETSDGLKKVLVEDVTDEEFELLLKLKKLEYLKSIKSMLKFFVVLTIASIVGGFMLWLLLQ